MLNWYETVFRRPYGTILVTGPTGSGKSTTLYATLGEINTAEKNIVTVEDPVEYRIRGINQVQVNPRIGLTFPTGLRSILRCDPDVVMIGEIRDRETAKTSVEAAKYKPSEAGAPGHTEHGWYPRGTLRAGSGTLEWAGCKKTSSLVFANCIRPVGRTLIM